MNIWVRRITVVALPLGLLQVQLKVSYSNCPLFFQDHGFGKTWDPASCTGNPACAPLIKEYLKLIREEQARSHVLHKQAKPIFVSKLGKMAQFINNQLSRPDLSLRERFVLLRDQAWFKLQFCAGDRAGDLALTVSQEVKKLHDDSGFALTHTFGKH